MQGERPVVAGEGVHHTRELFVRASDWAIEPLLFQRGTPDSVLRGNLFAPPPKGKRGAGAAGIPFARGWLWVFRRIRPHFTFSNFAIQTFSP